MKIIISFFKPLFRISYNYPVIVLIVSILIAFFAAQFAIKLKVDTDIANLLPENYHSVQALNRLKETVGGELAMDVAIKSDDFEANKRFTEDLLNKAITLYDKRTKDHFFKKYDFKRDTRVLEENALYLATPEELSQVKDYLTKKIEEVKLEANPFYFDLEDDEDSDTKTEEVSSIDFELKEEKED